MILTLSLNFIGFYFYQKFFSFILLAFSLFYMWLVSSLAGTNRIPFDFAEGESELVSGFNVEYSSKGFALIFLEADFDSYSFFIKVVMLSFLWIWVRGTLPPFRYDKLMYLSWNVYLPVSLNLLILFLGLKCFISTPMFQLIKNSLN